LGLLRTSECLRLQRARIALICGLQARFPFFFASIAARALVFVVTKSEQKNNSLLGATRFVHNNGVFSPRKPCEPITTSTNGGLLL
jgi:hypothetical protein